ncbi:MAG TPA: S53 family peptidase [Candidatus Sulfotelmatobacter sp.]|jgi:subtilase family serine protease
MRIVKLSVPARLPVLFSAISFSAILLASLFSFSSLSYAETPDRISGALAGGRTVALTGNVHRKALPQFDQGPADPALKLGYVTLLTVPTTSQQKALKQLLADQQNPKSPSFRKWLTPEQYADRFGLSQADVQKITTWLEGQGFKVVNVARGRNWIAFSGTAAQVQSAFGTEFHRYNVNGEMHVANATAPKIPAALSGIVVGMRGLHDFYLKPRAAKNLRAAHPDYYDTFLQQFNSASPPDFLAPGDIATIYDINALYTATPAIDGTGQKLVIVGQTDIYLADLNDFRSGFGLTQISGCTNNVSTGVISSCNTTNFQYVVPTGVYDPGTPSLNDISEADLDLEWSAAVARGAQIIYDNAPYDSSNLNSGVFGAWYDAVDNDRAPVISMSYGGCEFDDNFVLDASGNPLNDELELMQANSLGITFFNSSGDSGAAECDGGTNTNTTPANLAQGGVAVSYPAASPEVTGVGGTAVDWTTGFTSTYWGVVNATDGGSALAYVPETSWNDDEELFVAYPASSFQNGYTSAADVQERYAIVASGGGPSNCAQQSADNATCVAGFGQPSWQTVTLSGQAPARFSPDVSLLGSPNFPGYIFCTPQNAWVPNSTNTSSTCVSGISGALSLTDPSGNPAPSLVGGTSASSPIMAGILTLVNQYLGTTTGLGNINPTLYVLASTPSKGVFHQVTTGDNKVYCEVGQPAGTTADPWPTAMQCPTSGVFGYSASTSDSTTGYNMVTGLGSVDAANLASNWSAASSTAGTTFTLSPTVASYQVSQGSTANATINVTVPSGFSGTIVFTCTDGAPASTCTVPPSTNVSGQVSFSISTTLPTASLHMPSERPSRIFYAVLLPGLFGIVFVAGSRRGSKRGRVRGMRFLGLIVILGCSTLWLASCGGSSNSGNSNPGTAAGNYTITVTGTSGSTTASTSFTLAVQ